jgi:hypothetical protein
VEFPLLLHILGASILVGGLIVVLTVQLIGWSRETSAGALQLARVGFFSLLCVVLPGWILMRIGAQWIWTEAGWDNVDPEPTWLGIGWMTADVGGLLILLSLILAGIGARRLRQSRAATSTLVRVATVLTTIALVAYVITVWAMSAKPD